MFGRGKSKVMRNPGPEWISADCGRCFIASPVLLTFTSFIVRPSLGCRHEQDHVFSDCRSVFRRRRVKRFHARDHEPFRRSVDRLATLCAHPIAPTPKADSPAAETPPNRRPEAGRLKSHRNEPALQRPFPTVEFF